MQRFHAFSDARPNANSSRLVLGRVWLLLAAMLVLGNSFTSALHQDGACWFHGPLAAHRHAPNNASTVEFDRTP